jgi:cation:H+ antiporter
MLFSVCVLIASLALILGACHLFTNAVEWMGKRLNLSDGIVGSVLAGVGTAMPETMIPIVAILIEPGEASHEVGIGAILGAPFMLSTLAFFVTGVSVFAYSALGRRASRMEINRRVTERDLLFFLISYALVVATGLIHYRAVHIAIGVVVLILYVYYLRVVFSDTGVMDGHVRPLFFARRAAVPGFFPIILQLALSLGMIIAGAHYFVDATVAVATTLKVPAIVLSLIITPIATELPEKANSIIWTRDSKDALALGNITGAMVFQSTFPVTIGLLFTEWDLDGITLVSATIALLSGIVNYAILKARGKLSALQLVLSGILYLVFIGHVVGGVR